MVLGTELIGSTILHYHIIERLGGGGMGEVYLAQDQRLGRRVALKFLAGHVDSDPEARERLIREAQAAALLRSPHIAVTYDLVEHDGSLFIAMEYVEGELLSTRIARARCRWSRRIDIELQLADALDEAHARGIIHRDIKSANLMITSRQLVKVLDFGLAKFLQSPTPDQVNTLAGMTMPGLVLGTLNYMAPEQLSGGPVDHRADLFSAGVVLYEMLAARLPFPGNTLAEIADRILNHEPDAIARYNYAVPEDVEAIIRRALQKRPDFRYQTARDFYLDLLNARRRAAGDSSRGSGSWLSPIDFADAASPMPMAPVKAPKPAAAAVVAVLNFANITGNPADDWVGQGIAESLTADLTRIKSVSVVPREQIFELQRSLSELGRRIDDRQAMELGRRLGASVAVSGAYQRLGDRIRITAQGIEVAAGRQLATVKVDGRLEELFELQDRLVSELATGLEVNVAQQDLSAIADAGTQSLEAYQAFARGMMNLRLAERDSMDRGIALLEQAIEHDPNYVEAMVELAGALELKGSFPSQPAFFDKSLALVDRALKIRPDDAAAHVQRGDTLLVMGRADEAIAALQEGVRLQRRPGDGARQPGARLLARSGPRRRSHQRVRARAAAESRRRLHAPAAGPAVHAARRLRRGREHRQGSDSPAGPGDVRRDRPDRRRGAHAARATPTTARGATTRRSANTAASSRCCRWAIISCASARASSCSRSLVPRIGARVTSPPPNGTKRRRFACSRPGWRAAPTIRRPGTTWPCCTACAAMARRRGDISTTCSRSCRRSPAGACHAIRTSIPCAPPSPSAPPPDATSGRHRDSAGHMRELLSKRAHFRFLIV